MNPCTVGPDTDQKAVCPLTGTEIQHNFVLRRHLYLVHF